jgi:L-threonylcarbamoyladenylate synthase
LWKPRETKSPSKRQADPSAVTRARVTLAHGAPDRSELNPLDPSPAALDRAEAAIRRGQIVAIPTDALYTLVADPFSVPAVRKVYEAKGREIQRALPMLVRDVAMVEELARDITPRFRLLVRKFWPGPLTVIMPAAPHVPLRATGNTGRLAVRQANCRLADLLIARLNQPIIATSANISGLPTCRSGIEVFGIMDGRVDLVLDGGHCEGVGASTVDITDLDWKIIKQGVISEKEIAACLDMAE